MDPVVKIVAAAAGSDLPFPRAVLLRFESDVKSLCDNDEADAARAALILLNCCVMRIPTAIQRESIFNSTAPRSEGAGRSRKT